MDISNLLTFFIASVVLLVVPGPAVLYIVARSIDQGKLAGIISVLGIGFGTIFHVAAAAVGVSAIIMTSALAFNILKYVGAAYLIYMGVRKLLNKEENPTTSDIKGKDQKASRIFFQGAIVNLLNPKTALFFFAFLPQFVTQNTMSPSVQIILLGTFFILLGTISDGIYALLAGSLTEMLKGNSKILKLQHQLSSFIYIILGLLTLVAEPNLKK